MTAHGPESTGQDVNELLTALDFTPQKLSMRLGLLDLQEEDLALLRAMAPGVHAGLDAFVERLYQRFFRSPQTSSWMHGPGMVERLKPQQRRAVGNLFTRTLDEEDVRRCLRMGVVHHRVRLPPSWYIATYVHAVADHVDLAFAQAGSTAQAVKTVAALFKSVLFEASWVLDAYGMTLFSAMRELATTATRDAVAAPGGEAASAQAPGASPGSTVSLRLMPSEDAEARRHFLEIDDDTVALLREAAPRMQAALPAVLETFYRFFSSWEQTRALVPPESVERLKQQTGGYWRELTTSDFGRAYAALRSRLGLIHERIGVTPDVYLAGLCRQFSLILERVVPGAPDPVGLTKALVRAVFFDLSFILDAYLDARAQAALRTGNVAHEVLAGMTSAVAVVDARMRLESVNPALLAMFGWSASLVTHVRLSDVLPIPSLVELTRDAVEKRTPRATRQVRHGTRTFRATVMALAQRDAPGSRGGAALVLEELTDVAHLREDATREMEGFSQFVTAFDAVCWETDPADWTLRLVSFPAEAITGYREVQLLGKAGAWPALIPEPDRHRFLAVCGGLAAGEHAEVVHRLTRADGQVVWMRTSVHRSPTSPDRLRGISVDVTQAHEQETRRLSSVARLAGGVAHRYNNQLTVILGSLSFVADRPLEPEDLEMVAAARDAAHRSATLTRQLLAFAQGQLLRPRVVHLNEVIRGAGGAFSEVLGRQVELVMQLDPALWQCHVDPEQLESALLSLLANARDAMPHGGRVVLATRNVPGVSVTPDGHELTGAQVEVSIDDTGGGMEDHVRQRALEPFFTTKPDGLGMGLSMVHGFMAQSGGHMELRSQPGSGTVVRLRFPSVLPVAPARLPPPTAGARTVLLVDDEPNVRRVLARMLGRSGHVVLEADNAERAQEILRGTPVDLLLTDVVLEGGPSGTTLGRAARARLPRLPIVYISGFTRQELSLEDLDEREWFVQKPVDRQLLESVVRTALEAGETAALKAINN